MRESLTVDSSFLQTRQQMSREVELSRAKPSKRKRDVSKVSELLARGFMVEKSASLLTVHFFPHDMFSYYYRCKLSRFTLLLCVYDGSIYRHAANWLCS